MSADMTESETKDQDGESKKDKKKDKKDKKKKKKDKDKAGKDKRFNKKGKMTAEFYAEEEERLQTELVKLQYWIKHKGLRVVALFEGRDAAGKGGVIKRIADTMNPRGCRVVALGTPTERERSQW